MNSKNYWVKVGVATVVIAFVVSNAVKWVLAPVDDGNLSAYQVLLDGYKSGSYESMRSCAEAATQLSSDTDIRKSAGFFLRSSEFALQSGVSTFEEGNSFSGFVKGSIAAYLNPILSIKAVILLVEGFAVKNCLQQINAKYLPLLEQQILAGKAAFWAVAIVFIAIPITARRKRVQISLWLDSRETLTQTPEVTPQPLRSDE